MKLTDKEIDSIVKKVAERVVNILNAEQTGDTLLVPVLENMLDEPTENVISLGIAFAELNTHDKLLVIKGAIRTHFQMVKGVIMPYGQIQKYKLIQPDGIDFFFDAMGRMMMDQQKVFV